MTTSSGKFRWLTLLPLIAAVAAFASCRKKKGSSEDSTDLFGESAPVVVSGSQPVNGTLVVSNGGQVSVVGVDNDGNVAIAPPKTFRVLSASPNSSLRPVVTWTAASGATAYTVALSTNSSCSNPLVSADNVSSLTFTPAQSFAAGSYFACVSASNLGGKTIASNSPFAFTVTDLSAPTGEVALTGVASYANVLSSPAFPVAGTCNFGTIQVFGEDGVHSVTKSVACTSGAFSTTLDLSTLFEGVITIAASNDGMSVASAVVKDTVAPAVTGLVDDLTVTNSKTWSWACSEPACSFRFTVDTQAATAPSGSFAATASVVSNSGNGNSYLHVEAKDPAGNTSTLIHVHAVLDTLAPALTISASSDVNASGETTFALAGTCDETGGTVNWTIDDVNAGTTPLSATASCDGSVWSASSIDLSSLDDGTLTITANLTDPAGNAATEAQDSLLKDTVAPTLAVTVAPTANAITQTNYSFSGTCSETGRSVTWSIDDAANGATSPVTGSAACNGTSFAQSSVNVSALSEGTLTITANLTDSLGNAATPAARTLTKNTTAPSLNLTQPDPVNIANVGSFSLAGFCGVATASVLWSIDDQGNGGTPAVTGSATCNGTTWSQSGIDLTSLSSGTLDVTADMDDLGGNPAPQETTTTVKDLTAPTIAITAPTTVNSLNHTAYGFAGTCSETAGVVHFSVDDQGNGATAAVTGTAACNGTTWTAANVNVSSLSDGTMNFTADLDDAVGNSATQATATGSKDTVIPTVGINALAVVTSANKNAFGLTGTCSENTRSVGVSVDDQGNGATAAVTGSGTCTTGTWSVSLNLTSLSDGTLTATADHSDGASNPATQASRTTTKDATAPSVPDSFILNSPSSNVGNNASPVLRFTSLAGTELIRVWSDAGCTSEVANATAISTALNVTINLATDGTYNFWATAEDSNGNRSACSSTTINYTLDRQISAITSIDLTTPATSPGKNPTPTVTVNGVGAGDTVKLYTGSNCIASEQVGFAVAAGASIAITVDSGKFVADATYQIYARSNDAAGNFAACTGFSRSYTLDRTAPSAPTGVVRTTPAASIGQDTSPTFTVSGVATGNVIAIFSNNTCTTQLGSGTASGTNITIATSPLSIDGTYTVYANATDPAGNTSACSTANGTYSLDISAPSLTFVHIESGGGKAVAGITGQAIITFTATEPLLTKTVNILGSAATVINTSGTTYRATRTLTAGDAAGTVTFTIDYTDQVSNSGPQVTATTDASALTYNKSTYAPLFSVSDQTGAEQSAFSLDVNDSGTSNDTDNDGQAITYSCYYDMTANGVVTTAQSCSTLSGFTIGASTGVIAWTPSYTAAGVYELRVIGTDGTVDGEAIFKLTISNTNRLPVLSPVSNQSLILASSINFDMYDTNTSGDTDIDGDPITYSCTYDTTVDGSVVGGGNCTELDGIDFNSVTGYFTWTVQPTTPGDFEFQILGSDGIGQGSSIFTASVTIDISRLPQLNMVGNNTTSYFASLTDNNEVTLNGAPIPGYGNPSIFQSGNTFTLSTTAGDLLECTGGCFAITPTDGTAAWSTQSYSGTLLSTYMGRNNKAKIVVAAFDQPAYVEIRQGSGLITSGTVPANSILPFSNVSYAIGALWIQSDAPVSAYISTNTTYQDDGRIITAAAKEALAFVSGGGGTPSAISTTVNNTTVSAYRNDGTNFLDQIINISQIVTVTHTTATQNSALSAIAIYANQPVVSTQHADGDGTNSTPSLPKSMLSTHFAAPMDGDYTSFASFEAGEVLIINTAGTVISRNPMTRSGTAHAKAPYAYSYNPASIPAGTRFVCTTPCIGIFEPLVNDDETLMTGTKIDPMTLSSTDFADGNTLPPGFVGSRASECSGSNDFPNLTWTDLPWGTKSLAVVVEDTTNGNFVHLNLVDVAVTPNSVGPITASSGSVSFPSGIDGTNGYATTGWSGPCDTTTGTHTYQFKVYAMSALLGSASNNLTTAAFEAAYAAQILGSATITATYGP